jgi:hypothetical protein
MKKLLILSSGIIVLAAVGVIIAPNLVQAQGGNGNGTGYQEALTSKAQILGITKDQLQAELKTKTLHEVVEQKGISEDTWHEKMEAANKSRWEANGLTQAEIDSRLKQMEDRQASCDGTGTGNENAGMGKGTGYGRNQQ